MKGRTLLLASAGGHIDELSRLQPRLIPDTTDALWVTSETAQTRSLLAGRDVVWVPHIGPRDLWGVVRGVLPAIRHLRAWGVGRLITTGAALSLPYVVAARLRGISVTYVESAARITAPSLTGRIASALPGVECCCQSPQPLGRRWRPIGSVFDGYDGMEAVKRPVRRIVVSVGGERFSFRRAVDRLLEIIPDDVEVFWQTGSTPVDDLGLDAAVSVPQQRLAAEMVAADAVVIHAGVGSALSALDAGRVPVLLVRRATHHEHIDDHQTDIAADLGRRGLAVAGELADLTWSDVERAAGREARRDARVPTIRLFGGR